MAALAFLGLLFFYENYLPPDIILGGIFLGSLGTRQQELPLAASLIVWAVDLRVVQRWGDISIFNFA
jgi:hypothetical protein